MANDNIRKSTVEDSPADPDLKPATTPKGMEESDPANDQRSLDIGESGQFAPGGYYNQQGVTEADRLTLDDIKTSDDQK